MKDLASTENSVEPDKKPTPPNWAPSEGVSIKDVAGTGAQIGHKQPGDDHLDSPVTLPPQNNPHTCETKTAQKDTAVRPNIAALDDTVTKINDFVQSIQRVLRFSIDGESGNTFVNVIEKETDKLLRQTPAKDVIASLKDLNQHANTSVITSKQA